MRPSRALVCLVGLLAQLVVADGQHDLGTVLASNKDLSRFDALIKKYPEILLQLPSYSGVTIIAPTNRAFENIPYTALAAEWDPDDKAKTVPLLQYHILRGTVSTTSLHPGPSYVETTLLTDPRYTNVTGGQGVLVNKQPGDAVVFTSGMGTRCTLVTREIEFQGGLVQVVDNLLIPPARLASTAEAFQLSSFVGGLYAARLMPDVAYRQNITVFAPQDAAFDLVGGGLEKLDATALARVMRYHIVPGQVLASSTLSNGSRLETLARASSGGSQKESLLVRQAGNSKYINSAQIVQPDILIANGILHLISNVLNPDAQAVVPNPEIGTQPPVFPVNSAEHPFTSALPCTTECPVTTSDVSASATPTPTPTTSFFPRSSKGHAAPARCTAHLAGAAAAMGLLGVGAGLAPWL